MRPLLAFVFGSIAFLVTGCATQVLQSYVGQPITEPILDYGPPTNVVELENGRRAYQWAIDSSGYIPITTPSTGTIYGSGGYATVTTTSTSYVPYSDRCIYTLIAVEQQDRWIVESYRDPSFMCL